jgi:hypothetical protein
MHFMKMFVVLFCMQSLMVSARVKHDVTIDIFAIQLDKIVDLRAQTEAQRKEKARLESACALKEGKLASLYAVIASSHLSLADKIRAAGYILGANHRELQEIILRDKIVALHREINCRALMSHFNEIKPAFGKRLEDMSDEVNQAIEKAGSTMPLITPVHLIDMIQKQGELYSNPQAMLSELRSDLDRTPKTGEIPLRFPLKN